MKLIDTLEYQVLYNRIKHDKIPLKTAYKLNKLHTKIKVENKFYEEEFQKLLDKYAKKDDNGDFLMNEDGSGVMIKEDLQRECHQKIEELQNMEVDIEKILFTLDELNCIEVSPMELNSLIPFIEG